MATKSFSSELLRSMKRLGLIDYDLRQKLSRKQEGVVRELASEYGQVLKHPEWFHIATVKSETKKTLEKSGYKVTPTNRAIIPLKGFSSARIKKGSIVFSTGTMTERTYLVGAPDFLPKLKTVSRRRLKNNQMITARIGDNAPFNTRFGSFKGLQYYINNVFKPNDQGMTKAQVLSLLSVVTVEKKVIRGKNAKKKGGPKGGRN